MAASITMSLAVLALAQPGTVIATAPTQAFILTQTRVISADLAASRIVVSRAVSPGAGSKIVASGSFVFLQRQRAVDILDGRTLQRVQGMEFSDDIRDIAASGSLLIVAVGVEVHIVRVRPDGQTSILRSVRLPKPADALTASGSLVYVIDDLRTPLFVHLIDIARPEDPRVDSIQWDDTNAHLQAQAVADRWYVLVSYTTISERGQYVAMLSARTPVRQLGQRVVALERKPVSAAAPAPSFVEEFRVHSGVLYGTSSVDGHLWLVRRPLGPETAETRKVIGLGAGGAALPTRRGVIDLVGSRLYVGTSSALIAFDLDPARAPVRVMSLPVPSPIISFTVQAPGR